MNYSLYSMLVVAYLIGSLSFAIIVSKLMRLSDPRHYGSNNAGATNVMRSGNKKAAALTLVGDLLKGLLVVIVARIIMHNIDGGEAIVGICGVLAVIGHIYPIFFKFKGGKGVATAIGVLLGFSPLLALLLVGTWLLVFKASKISSLAAITATLLSPLYAFILLGNSSYFGATTIIAFFVLYKHKQNIIRLIKGEEHRFKSEAKSSLPSQTLTTTVANSLSIESLKFDPNSDLYAVLGVAASATHDEITSAYHNLVQNSLPEDEAFSGDLEEKHALSQLPRIKYAYQVLTHYRQHYDDIRRKYVIQQEPGSLNPDNENA